MKIKLYRMIDFGNEVVMTVSDIQDYENYEPPGCICLSEPLEVEFTMLKNGEAEKQEIAMIDKKITEIMAETESNLTRLKQRKSELLAIGNGE